MLPRNYSQNLDVEAYPLRTIQSLTDLHLHNLHLDEPVAPDHHREAAHTAEEVVDPRPVHPDAMRIYRAYNGKFQWTRYIPIFGPAIEAFGPKFIFGLDFMEFMSKGMANNLLQNSFLPMFTKRFKCSAMQYQRYNTVAMMGWSIKPFTALISDSFAIYGYKKRWYMVVSAIIGAVSCIIYALLPPKAGSGATAAAMAFLAGYGMANLDILSEGLYSRLMRQCPLAAPTLVSSVWWMLNFAGIIASFIEGPLSDSGMEAVGAYIAGGCIVLTIPVFFVNLLGESTNRDERRQDVIALQREAALAGRGRDEADPVDDDDTLSPMELAALKKNCDLDQSFDAAFISTAVEEPYVGHAADLDAADTGAGTAEEDEIEIPTYCGGMVEFNREVIGRNHRVFIYALVMTLGVIATVIATINGSTWPLLITCTIVSAILVLVSFWALPFVVAKASLFAFLNQMLYVQITGPLNTFYVATEKEYPPGPHFSYFFYMSLTSVIGNIASVVGVTLFAYIFARRSYRLTFIITIFAEIAGSIFDLIMVKRWNVDVGIPDKLTYIWGDAVVYQVAYMLAWMPMTVLLCQLCPRGSESIVYALLAGFSNLGQTMSREIGTLLMDFALPVQTTTIPYDFSNLPWLIIICHLLIPLLLLPLVLVLIPAARVCDELDGDGNVIGEKGQTDGAARKPANKDEHIREKPLHEEDEPTTPPA